jgi:hypothetical protein
MALDLPRSECPRSDSRARVEVIECANVLTPARIKEIAGRTAIASRAGVEAQVQHARDEADRRVVRRGADPSKYKFS